MIFRSPLGAQQRRLARFKGYRGDMWTQGFQTQGGGADSMTGWLQQAKEGTTGIVGMFTDLINPEAAKVRRAQEAEIQASIAQGQWAQAQALIALTQAEADRNKWLIGGAVVLGSGLIFWKILSGRSA